MSRVLVCQQCLEFGKRTPLPKGSEPNQKYCDLCGRDRIRASKARWQRNWRARAKLAYGIQGDEPDTAGE